MALAVAVGLMLPAAHRIEAAVIDGVARTAWRPASFLMHQGVTAIPTGPRPVAVAAPSDVSAPVVASTLKP
jgi:hypothetical protein